jgi:hypothetical protein
LGEGQHSTKKRQLIHHEGREAHEGKKKTIGLRERLTDFLAKYFAPFE